MVLNVAGLSYQVGEKQILKEVNLCIEKGQFVGLVGPNGSGKSTLLRNIYRALSPSSGKIFLEGKDVSLMKYRDSAKAMSVLRQEFFGDFDYSVGEMVAMGRAAHHGLLETETEQDWSLVQTSLARVGMLAYEERMFSTLSGGEKQRVLIARAMAQQAQFMILDEPTNHLDVYYKIQTLELVKNLNITVFAAIHDLELAAGYCDQMMVLNEGQIVAVGTPPQVLTPSLLESVFRVHGKVLWHEETKRMTIQYLGMVKE